MKMDRIVIIEDGRVAAQGTHQELLEQVGLYQKLWSIQAGGFLDNDESPAETADADNEEDETSKEKES